MLCLPRLVRLCQEAARFQGSRIDRQAHTRVHALIRAFRLHRGGANCHTKLRGLACRVVVIPAVAFHTRHLCIVLPIVCLAVVSAVDNLECLC